MIDLFTEQGMALAGSATGFLFRQYAENKKRAHEEKLALIDARDASMDRAAQRDGKGGTWMRRMIYGLVAIVFLSVIAAGFMEVPVVVEQPVTKGFLFWKRTFTEFATIEGVLFPPEIRQGFMYLLCFYTSQAIK